MPIARSSTTGGGPPGLIVDLQVQLAELGRASSSSRRRQRRREQPARKIIEAPSRQAREGHRCQDRRQRRTCRAAPRSSTACPGLGPHCRRRRSSPGCPSSAASASSRSPPWSASPPTTTRAASTKAQRHINGGRRELRDLLYMATFAAATRHNPVAQGLLPTAARQGEERQGRPRRLHAQAARHPQHHAGAGSEMEPARCRQPPRMSERARRGRRPASTACQPTSPVSGRGQGRSRRRRGREAPALSPADHRATSFTKTVASLASLRSARRG